MAPGKRLGTADQNAQQFAGAGIGGQPALNGELSDTLWFHLTSSTCEAHHIERPKRELTTKRIRQGLRDKCSLVVQAGDIQEGHDVCCLVAFGADAVHPYLMLRLVKDGLIFKDGDTKQENRLDGREALENLFAALEDTIKKVISKMGITTIEGYRGAQLFEAVLAGSCRSPETRTAVLTT